MKDFIELLKLPTYLLAALAVASGILLFAPDNLIQKLYMTEFRNKYGFTLGLMFVIAVSILFILFCKKIKEWYDLKRLKKEQDKFLKELHGNKVELINMFFQQPTRTLELPMQDGLVLELQHYNVISPAGQTHLVSMPNPKIKFFLQPWVEMRIKENEELQKKYHC